MLERTAHHALRINLRLGRRLEFQLKQLEAADAGMAVTLDGEERTRIGNGVPGSAGLPTRDWLWMYREHSSAVVKLLSEQRLRQRTPIVIDGEVTDQELIEQLGETMSKAEAEELLQRVKSGNVEPVVETE